MANNHFDVLIIGGGQAGIPLAHRLAGAGRRVALAERKYLGGTCVNYGCTPTKAALASARVAHQAHRADEYGLRVPTVEVDFPAVLDRARRILQRSREGLQNGFEGAKNPELLRGHMRFEGRDGDGFRLRMDGQVFRAEQAVINTGARTLLPPIDGLDSVDFLHAGNWLDHDEQPAHLVIIGGGYVGMEMGQFYRRVGSRVTVVQRGAQVIPHEDKDVAEALQQVLENEGVQFYLGCQATRVEERGGGIVVELEAKDGETEEVEASHLFLATGRRPNTNDLGLETLGVEPDDQGFLAVDERLATGVEGLWAAGDVRGGPMFTHTSWDDHRILASQLVGDGARTTERVVPYAIFTDPELGRVGLTEREAREKGHDAKVARFDMEKNGKAIEIGETKGFIKVIVDAQTDRILGAAVLAAEGAELVHTYIALMNAEAPYTVLREAVHIHPTLSEAVQSALAGLE